jgi:hypothetical protein
MDKNPKTLSIVKKNMNPQKTGKHSSQADWKKSGGLFSTIFFDVFEYLRDSSGVYLSVVILRHILKGFHCRPLFKVVIFVWNEELYISRNKIVIE